MKGCVALGSDVSEVDKSSFASVNGFFDVGVSIWSVRWRFEDEPVAGAVNVVVVVEVWWLVWLFVPVIVRL